VLVLGLNAPMAELAAGFVAARKSARCRGFAVGRTIFEEPSRQWLAGAINDATLKTRVRERFETLIGAWRAAGRNA
jgi:5-dehydro-2-deoxygluconokinase